MSVSRKNKALRILDVLKQTFPDAKIELEYDHHDPWQLLVVVALSAQTTDKKVNTISTALFQRFKTVHDFAKATPSEVEPYIKSIGLFRNKAKNVVLAAQKVVTDFNGHIPKTRALLETLPGVGKKTSAVIVANAFHEPAIAVDTHVFRVTHRLGLASAPKPDQVEEELNHIIPKDHMLFAHHSFIFLGRRICFARKPACSICPLAKLCPKIGVTESQ